MKWIEECKQWWRIHTVQFWIFIGLVPEIMAQLSDDVKDYLPGPIRAGASVVALISIFLRLKAQPALKKD